MEKDRKRENKTVNSFTFTFSRFHLKAESARSLPPFYGAFAAALLIFDPGRKAGTVFAGILSAAPVLGFLPFRRVAKHPRGYSAPVKLYVPVSQHTAFTFNQT